MSTAFPHTEPAPVAFGTFHAAFAFFGVRPVNPRACWSAASPDGTLTVLTFWRAHRQWDGNRYDIRGREAIGADGRPLPWVRLKGNRFRRRHIEQALATTGGLVHALLVEPTDPDAPPRTPLRRRVSAPILALPGRFRIGDHDPETGAFLAIPAPS